MSLFDSWDMEAPEAPNYAEATREGIAADVSTLPLRRLIDSAAKRGTKVTYTDPSTGKETTADFTGAGDVDISRLMVDFGIESADKLAAAQIEQSKKYGADTIKQRIEELKLSDPEGYALRKEMGGSVLSELMLGKELDPDMKSQVVEAERAGQAARGNILGESSGAAEAMQVGNAGYRIWQQRLANAAAFLSGATPTAQFSALSGAQAGAAPFNPQGMAAGATVNPNAGAAGWNAATDTWKMNFQSNAWNKENNVWQGMYDDFNAMLQSAAGGAVGFAMG